MRLLLSFLAFAVTFAIERWFVDPLRIVPGGIVALELARTPARAIAVVNTWAAAGILSRVYWGIVFDYPFLAAYAWFLATLAGRMQWTQPTIDRGIVYAIVAAAAFDATENVGLFVMLDGDPTQLWTMTTAVCAAVKFVLLGCAAIYLASGGVVLLARRLRR